jgi:hypothetical protein
MGSSKPKIPIIGEEWKCEVKVLKCARRLWMPCALVFGVALLAACSTQQSGTPVTATSTTPTVAASLNAVATSSQSTTPSTTSMAIPPMSTTVTSAAIDSSTPNAAAPADLAPDPNGAESRCLLGGKPLNIEFYGVDASNVCAKYVPVLAALGQPNLAVHPYSAGGEIPGGYTVGCGLSYPLDFGRLQASVQGYVGRSIDAGDAGPLAKSVCDRLLELGWVPATG